MTTVQHTLVVGLLALLWPQAADAGILIEILSPGEESVDVTLSWSALDPATGEGEAERSGQLTLSTPWQGSLELDRTSSWSIDATTPGFWAPLSRADPDTSSINISWVPSVEMMGQVAPETPEAHPVEIQAWVARDAEKAQLLSAWQSLRCLQDNDRFSCIAPRDLQAVKFSAEGRVPLYFWNLEVSESRLSLGKLELHRGASLSGWVLTERSGEGDDGAIQLELAPRATGWQEDATERRRTSLRVEYTEANEEGFFLLGPVPVGGYDLVASAPGFMTHRIEDIDMTAGTEIVLDEVIELLPPSGLDVYISPPVDYEQQPWSVALMSLQSTSHVLKTVEQSAAGFDGHWHLDAASIGRFRLEVRDHKGAAWLVRDLELSGVHEPLFFEVDSVLVRGTLTLGGEPTDGVVVFGGRHGRPNAEVLVFEGLFEGILPRDGEWKVEVDIAGDASVMAEPVTVERRAGEPVARLEIELPDTLLEGEVWQGDESVAGAFVHVFRQDESGQNEQRRLARVRTDADGKFRFRGLKPGRAQVSAYLGAFDPVSDWVEVEFREAPPIPSLRLELFEKTDFRGRVLSNQGPVAGAQVFVQPGLRSAMRWPAEAISNANGDISFRLPSQSAGEVVFLMMAAGFGFSIQPGNLEATREMTLSLSVDKGDLTLTYPAGSLYFDGVPVAVSTLLAKMIPVNRIAPSPGGGVVLKGMAAGEYSQCPGNHPSEHCVSGVLTPSGVLALEILDLDEGKQ